MQEKGKLTEYFRISVKFCAGAAYLWLSFNATKIMDLQEMSHKSNLILPFSSKMGLKGREIDAKICITPKENIK